MRTEIQEKLTHVVHAVAAAYLLVVFLSLFAVRGHIFEFPVIIVDTVVSLLYLFDLFIHRKRTKLAWFIDGLSVLPALRLNTARTRL